MSSNLLLISTSFHFSACPFPLCCFVLFFFTYFNPNIREKSSRWSNCSSRPGHWFLIDFGLKTACYYVAISTNLAEQNCEQLCFSSRVLLENTSHNNLVICSNTATHVSFWTEITDKMTSFSNNEHAIVISIPKHAIYYNCTCKI